MRTLLMIAVCRGNASAGVGLERGGHHRTEHLHSLLGGGLGGVIHCPNSLSRLAPADQHLIGAEIQFVTMDSREKIGGGCFTISGRMPLYYHRLSPSLWVF